MATNKQDHRARELARNIFLVLVAAALIFIFFNLDLVRKGESVFTKSADKKLKFAGGLGRHDYSAGELDRLLKYIRDRNELFTEVKVAASAQDNYREISPDTDILFELQVTLADGFTFTTPTHRTSRRDLVRNILNKLDKDMRAYEELKKQGRNPKSMINTM